MKHKSFLLLMVALLTTIATHAYNFQSGDLDYYITSDTTVEVTYQGSSNYQGLTTATIPETVTYDGTTYSVTSIGEYAFSRCTSLISITIGNSVTSIGYEAFYECSALTSIILPNSVTSIGDGAFAWCSALTSIILPDSVTSIGVDAFYGCSSLTSITIPNSVTSIGNYAFRGCSSLTSITIPNSVTSIGGSAFYGCSSLTSITIPNSVTSIGNYAFRGCSSLTSITIPNSVTSIGGSAFYGCSSLTSITIPNSVTSIGNNAFFGCSALTSITLSNSVTSIGDWAFGRCSSLTSITIPNSVTSIGYEAFVFCSSLTSISIPKSVINVGVGIFDNCFSLSSIKVENGNTTYDSRDNCNAIIETENNILIAGCQSTIIPSTVTSIGGEAFFGCSNLTNITIPNSIKNIGTFAFYNCSNLDSITIPNSVTSIEYRAFESCSNLKSITIPDSITTIEWMTFCYCANLNSVTLGNSVTSIGDAAFGYCSALTSITCLATTPPVCSDNPFYEVPRTIPLYVPAESVEAYKAANTWKEFQVQALPPSYSPVDLVSITVDGEEIADFDPKALTYDIALPEGTTTIPTIDATAYNEDAQVLLIQATTLPGQASAVVITPDSIQTYTVRFTVTTSSDATLAALQYNGISVPDFLPTQTAYSVQLPYNTIEVPVVTATATHPSARVVIVQAGILTGQASVVVLSADGSQSNIYTVLFSLAPSTDATLSSLTYDGMLVPFFEAGTLHYTVDLPSETSTLPQVDAVANDLGAQITIHQATTLPGEASVEVLAADNTTRQTYTIYFSKKSTPTDISDRPDATGTDSDKGAEKLLRNGQVLIIRNGKTYSIMGQRL